MIILYLVASLVCSFASVYTVRSVRKWEVTMGAPLPRHCAIPLVLIAIAVWLIGVMMLRAWLTGGSGL